MNNFTVHLLRNICIMIFKYYILLLINVYQKGILLINK